MAKQTFTTGQVLTAAQLTNLQQTALGGGSPSVKTTSYVLVAADAGTVIQMNSTSATTVTVNTGLFSSGDSVQIQNIGSGTTTITAGTATVNSAGSLAVSQYDGGFLYFSSASSAIWFDYTQPGTASPLTTKGDLYTRTSSADSRIPVGANGTTLVADSAEATGLKWATPSSGNFSGVSLYNSVTAQSIANNTFTALTFDSENFDTDSFHSTSTNTSRMTVPSGKSGYYEIKFQVYWNVNQTGIRQLAIYKNGSVILGSGDFETDDASAYVPSILSTIVNLSVGDYIELYCKQTSGGALNVYRGSAECVAIMQFLGA